MDYYNDQRQSLEKDLAPYRPIEPSGWANEFQSIFGFCDRRKFEILVYQRKISEILELGIPQTDEISDFPSLSSKSKEKNVGLSALNGKRQFETFSQELNDCHRTIENFLALIRCCRELLDLRLNCENETKFWEFLTKSFDAQKESFFGESGILETLAKNFENCRLRMDQTTVYELRQLSRGC